MPEGDGSPLRAHLAAVERNTGRRVERLHRRCPPESEHVWEWFHEIGAIQLGRQPLTHTEIAAWTSNTGRRLTSDEAVMLKKLDMVRMQVVIGGSNER